MRLRYFVTATGTHVGKTFITAALARQAKALGRSVAVYKPVMSGFDPEDPENADAALLLKSLGHDVTSGALEAMSPWRFSAPVAPSVAARLENRVLDFEALVQHGKNVAMSAEDVVLIEGVGGVMVPLDDHHTVLDWIEALGWPVLLVTGTYLGTLSHTLTALSVLRQKNIPVRAIVVNQSENEADSRTDTTQEIERWAQKSLVLPVLRQNAGSSAILPDLSALL